MQNSRTAEQQNSRTAEQQNALTDFGFSPDVLTDRKTELLQLLGQIAPELLSDKQLNLDALKALLSDDYIAPTDEHYELSWAGKSAARREIQKSTSHTLKPSAGNPERAQHILIEGENLEVLRVLQKSYHNKVKMIYIDPPYNTGNDSFVYPDDYSETLDEYQRRTGEKNEQGYLNKQSLWKKNSKESGQYHSAWLSMMLPRLYLARNLLRDDGVIFISIDDNEAANLKLLCDEVFGAENFIAQCIRRTINSGKHDTKTVAVYHEFVLIYAKKIDEIELNKKKKNDSERNKLYRERDVHEEVRGRYYVSQLNKNSIQYSDSLNFPIVGPDGVEIYPGNGFDDKEWCWRWGKEKVEWGFKNEFLVFKKQGDQYKVYAKSYEFMDNNGNYIERTNPYSTLEFTAKEYGNFSATPELSELFGGKKYFNFPKSKTFLNGLIVLSGAKEDDIILDFFAGSGTTAHAVMELNAEDGGNRQSISVQMPELLEENSEAYKAGYRTIADITRARIDKVISKLKEEYPEKTEDLACAHFTLAPSNFKIWHNDLSTVDELRAQLELHQEAEQDLTKLQDSQKAMLTELLLKNGLGVMGVHAVSKAKVLDCGITIYRVFMEDDKHLWLCFETYQEQLKHEIVAARPAQVMLLNSCFIGDKADEQLSNLRLELADLEIGLLVI